MKGADREWFENYPKLYKTYFMDTRGVVNQNFIGKFISLFKIFKAFIKSIMIFREFKVSKVISVGGFSAAPASLATIFTNRELYIHEQNSVMGKLNQITSKMAKEVFSSYLNSSKVKDYPIDSKFFLNSRIRKEIKTIIFLGGSQGATAINNFAITVAQSLKDKKISIIHQTGKNDFERVKKEYQKLDIEVDIFSFSNNLLEKMDKADFAVSRSGASTLWELVALGIPTLFIPYPFAASNHQYYNAEYLAKKDLCFLKKEKELDKNYFLDIISQDIEVKSRKLRDEIKKDAIINIVDEILIH